MDWLKKSLQRFNYEIALLVISAFYFIALAPIFSGPTDNMGTHYLLSYDLGFISRGFIGTIVKLLFPVVTKKKLVLLISTLVFMIVLATVILLGKVIRKTGDTRAFYIAAFYISAPWGIPQWFIDTNFGTFDAYLFAITLLCLVLLAKKRAVWLIPILCIIAMLIHEGFLFMFAPFIVAISIYNVYKDERINSYYLVTTILTILAIVGTFLCIELFSGVSFNSVGEFINYLQPRATFKPSYIMLYYEYFAGIKGNVQFVLHGIYNYLKSLSMTIILLSPIILLFYYCWRNFIVQSKHSKYLASMLVLSTLGAVPLFDIGVDYGRWLSAILTCNFMLFFYLIYCGDLKIKEITVHFNKNYLPFMICIALVYPVIGPYNEGTHFAVTSRLLGILHSLMY